MMKTSKFSVDKERERLKTILKEQFAEQLQQQGDDTTQQQQPQQQTLIPLTPDQLNKKAEEISNKFINNIFASVKQSLGDAYYDDTQDKLVKDVKIKNLLTTDFKTYLNKVLNTAAKQSTGTELPGVGVNKTNV